MEKKDGNCVIKDDFHQIRDSMLGSDGVILASPIFFYTVSAHTKIFFDVIDTSLWKSLLYRGLDFEKDILEHPDYLQESYEAGKQLAISLQNT